MFGKMAEAQNVILAELETQYGGSEKSCCIGWEWSVKTS